MSNADYYFIWTCCYFISIIFLYICSDYKNLLYFDTIMYIRPCALYMLQVDLLCVY